MARSGRYRIAVDFPDLDAARLFFGSMVDAGVFGDADVRLFAMDGLDDQRKAGGITGSNTLVVRRRGDRPAEQEVT